MLYLLTALGYWEILISSVILYVVVPLSHRNFLSVTHMEDCKPTPSPFQFGVKLSATCTCPKVYATLYRQLVGSLLYLTHSCPDLSFAVGRVSRYMQTPHESHWKAAKRIL